MGIRNWIILGASVFGCWGIVATPAVAEIKRIDFTVRSEPNQSFSTLMQQAESLATSFIEQGFAEDTSVTEISVNILGERNGQQVPLLVSRVVRSDWQNQPEIRPWTRYFRTSAVLLGFRKPSEPNYTPAIAPNSPEPNSTTTTNTQQQSPASGATSIQQPTVTPNTTESSVSPIPTPASTIVQPPTPTPTTGNTTNTTQPITSPGATLEESDPGFR